MEQTSAKREKRKSLLRIAIPIILSSCLQISYDITDMFWVGKLGSGEVAAVGTAGFYIKLGWSLISVITIGTMVSVSHSIGAEKKDRIRHFISCGIRSTFMLGIFYALFIFMLAEPLISLFNIERPEVNTMAQNYLRISSITVLIMFMNLLFTAIIDAHGKTQFSFRAVLYGNIVNIILDPLFIFYFGLGVEGAAWATALSQGCAMMYAIYLLRHRLELTLSIKAVPRKFLRKILGIGTAPAMQRILFSLIGIAIGRIVSIWGTDAIAAQKLGLQIESLSFLLMNGLMQATSILIGQYYGERNTDMIRKVLSYKHQAWILYFHTCHIHIFSFPGNPTVVFREGGCHHRNRQCLSAYSRLLTVVCHTRNSYCGSLYRTGAYQISGNREYRVHHNEDTSCPSAWQKYGNGNRWCLVEHIAYQRDKGHCTLSVI